MVKSGAAVRYPQQTNRKIQEFFIISSVICILSLIIYFYPPFGTGISKTDISTVKQTGTRLGGQCSEIIIELI
jgi:hypothetical protein